MCIIPEYGMTQEHHSKALVLLCLVIHITYLLLELAPICMVHLPYQCDYMPFFVAFRGVRCCKSNRLRALLKTHLLECSVLKVQICSHVVLSGYIFGSFILRRQKMQWSHILHGGYVLKVVCKPKISYSHNYLWKHLKSPIKVHTFVYAL
jgi:hypothetical protein